ncbi:MAG TPA: hypothetical protein EYP65_06745 [Armatimonadetes bacterium]|nr:hypothetical protein [Armatimonadota bacterium]
MLEMGSEERVRELERRLEDLRVRRIMVEKEVNALRRKVAMSPANPHLRRDLEKAERELREVLSEEEATKKRLEEIKGATGVGEKEGGE